MKGFLRLGIGKIGGEMRENGAFSRGNSHFREVGDESLKRNDISGIGRSNSIFLCEIRVERDEFRAEKLVFQFYFT